MRRFSTMSVLLALALASCSLDPFEPTIAGNRDAAVGRDAGSGSSDAGADTDGGADAGAGLDGGSDAGSELVDAGVDAGLDAGTDAGPIDACVVGTETCDGFDEDCDGMVDEDADAVCMNACGVMGTQRCVGGALADCDAPAPPDETCNGLDDDCDGMVDETGGCGCPVRHYGGHAYLFCGNLRDWNEARTECMRNGYDLVTIDDTLENDFVRDTALMTRNRDWWIGYNDMATEGMFEWVSGATSTFTDWAPGQPDGAGFMSDCAEISDGSAAGEVRGMWDDDTCIDNAPYVCESP